MALEKNVLRLLGNTAATSEGGVCFGDSGGPHFLNVAGTEVDVAITSPPSDARCRANGSNYRLDTPSARVFLSQFVSLP
jgi:hypothetical protein